MVTPPRSAACPARVIASTGLAVVQAGQVADGVGAGVEGEVDVGVDQAGQQCRAAQVDDVRALRGGPPGVDGDDGGAVDHDERIGDHGGAGAVEQPRRPQRG